MTSMRIVSTRLLQIATLFAFVTITQLSFGDVYQWEYIDPLNPSLGRQQSSTLAKGGKGLTPGRQLKAQGRDLTRAYLSTFDLSDSIFTQGVLEEADFSGSSLRSAHLYGAKILNASFRNANLEHARFVESNITSADFTDASIRQADFADAQGLSAQQIYSTASYKRKDLTGVRFSENDLSGWNLVGQNLTGANFGMDGDFYSPARIENADFTDAIIASANFNRNQWLTKSKIYSTESYKQGNLRGVVFSGNYLPELNMSNQNLSESNLSNSDLRRSDFRNADLSGANLQGAELWSTNFTGADLNGAYAGSASFRNSSFRNANLSGVSFGSSNLENADFTDARIARALFSDSWAGLTLTQLFSTSSYKSGDLNGVGLSGQNLRDVDFSGMNLRGANFSHAKLSGASFHGADISGAGFGGTAELEDGFDQSQLYATSSYLRRDLRGVGLEENNLRGWNFSEQDLADARFVYSDLQGADFSNAMIAGADLSATSYGAITNDQLFSTASYKLGSLARVNLSDHDFSGCSFAYMDLSGASLRQADLTSANLRGANLSMTDLYNVIVSGADLRDANLTDADFGGFTEYQDVDLRGADLRGIFGLYPGYIARRENAIWRDGKVERLHVVGGDQMRVWDYGKDLQIEVREGFKIEEDGTLKIVFEDRAWGSTISFEEAISVELAGTLDLQIAAGNDPAGFVGASYKIFDWTGVSPTGSFDKILTSSELRWDVSLLYVTGEVTLLSAIPEPTSLVSSVVCVVLMLGARFRAVTSAA